MESSIIFGIDSCFEVGATEYVSFSASSTDWAFNLTELFFGNFSDSKNVTGYLSSAFPYLSVDSD